MCSRKSSRIRDLFHTGDTSACQGLCEPGERLIFKLSVLGHHTFCPGRSTGWKAVLLNNSINGRSFLLWEFLRKNHHDLDWLALQVLQSNFNWKTNKNFAEISIILNNLSVVNDPADPYREDHHCKV